jgi:hypothetical protein
MKMVADEGLVPGRLDMGLLDLVCRRLHAGRRGLRKLGSANGQGPNARPDGAHDTRSAGPGRARDDDRRACDDAPVTTDRPHRRGHGRRITAAVLFTPVAALVSGLAAPGAVLAHGPVPAEPPTVANLLFGWSYEPLVLLPLIGSVLAWIVVVRHVDAAHPATPVPRARTLAFLAGMTAIAFALQSGIARYDTALFSVHMVQHVLLILAATLSAYILAGALAGPDWSAAARGAVVPSLSPAWRTATDWMSFKFLSSSAWSANTT